MPTKLTYTGAEVQELLDKIEKGDFDNAKTLEGHPASYFAIASEFTSLAESFATEQGRVDTLCGYFNNGSANDALSLGGQLPSYYATALQYEILQQTLTDFKSLFDSMFEKDSDGNIHAKLSLWSSGGITAGGVGSGGSGGGGISYNRLDAWSDYSADKAGYVLSALLGKDLDNRVSALANAGYITTSALAPYALRSEIPSLEPYFLSSNFTKSNIKATLGISDWALASVKPTYSWSEINSRPTALSQFTDDVVAGNYLPKNGTAADSLKLNGYSAGFRVGKTTIPVINASGAFEIGYILDFHRGDETTGADYSTRLRCEAPSGNTVLLPQVSGTLALLSDIPTKLSQLTDDVVAGKYLPLSGGKIIGKGDYQWVQLRLSGNIPNIMFEQYEVEKGCVGWMTNIGLRLQNANGYGLAVKDSNEPIYYWGENGSAQRTLLHSGNYSDYALSINGGTVNGSITAPSFIGNLAGNADSATRLLAYTHNSGGYSLVSGTRTDGTLSRDIYDNGRALIYRSVGQGVNAEIATIDSNVASATKLQTPRTIWGQSFDGTADITGALTAPSLFSAGIYIGCDASGVASDNYAKEINTFANKLYLQYRGGDLDLCGGGGTTYIGGALDGKTANFTSLTSPAITTNSLTIGGATITYDSVNEALCVNGNMYALGGITAGGAGISAYTSLEARVARLEQQLNIS